jgi:hypothetical protein
VTISKLNAHIIYIKGFRLEIGRESRIKATFGGAVHEMSVVSSSLEAERTHLYILSESAKDKIESRGAASRD